MEMTGRLLIDGRDAYPAYGVYVTSGGWGGVAAMPPLKAVESNDWQEEDGSEPDLSSPVLDSRELTLSVAVKDADTGFPRLMAALSDGAYHAFECAEIGRTLVLRLVSHTAMAKAGGLGKATLKLADDFPLAGYEYSGPGGTTPLPSRGGGYALDGRPLAAYGVRVLKGTDADLARVPDVKPNLKRSAYGEAGAEYDPENVTYKARDARLSLLMTAGTAEEFWRNRDALLYDLARPGMRTLTAESPGRSWECWYKGMNVTKLAINPSGGVWMGFTLTLTLSKELTDGALGSEDGAAVTDEDGDKGIEVRAELLRSYEKALTAAMAAGRAAAAADNATGGDGDATQADGRTGSPASSAGIRLVKISELPLADVSPGMRTIATDALGRSVAVSLARMYAHTHPTSEVTGLDTLLRGYSDRLAELQSGKLDKSALLRITEAEIDEITGVTGGGASAAGGGTLIVPIADEYINSM